MAYMKPIMIEEGVGDIGLTPGEPINLFRFDHFGIADEIAQNPKALQSIDLITSHGFGIGNPLGRGYANTNNDGAVLLRKHRPELITWVTSDSWRKMGSVFGAALCEQIYGNNVNAFIPWAGIQRSSEWGKTNKHDACAISVLEDSTFQVNRGYYVYKQFTLAGRPGMRLARTVINRPDVFIAAFAQQATENPDAFVVVNLGESNRYVTDLVEISLNVNGNSYYYTFPYKDLVLAYKQQKPDQMKNVEFATEPTETGYIMEFGFPWKTLGGTSEVAPQFNFNVNVRDGRDMPHGHIGWLGDNNEFTGKILTDNENTEQGESTIVIQRKDSPQIDGIEDNSWKRVQSYGISNNRMPGTLPMISGKWKMTFDDENLYVLVKVNDPTNEQGRQLQIRVTGTP